VLPRGAGERLPWTHRIDANLGYNVRVAKDSVVSLTMDVFNLFNFQEVAATDERYTGADVLPIAGGTKADLDTKLTYDDGTPFDPNDKNKNFGKASAYQAPRSFRFGARVTF